MNSIARKALSVAVGVALVAIPAAATGLQTIDDVRVDALVSTHWGQRSDTGYSNTGSPCFNYYTPNNYPCGCVATPIAQLLWYWRYPKSTPARVSRCKVDGTEVDLPYGGVDYNYAAMPTIAAGADELARAAIGRLTYDCAVVMHSWFMSASTFAYGMFSFVQLREVFGYASAVGYVPFDSITLTAEIKKTIIANLDAKCPVMIALTNTGHLGHQALIDGYGYHGGKLYFHLNLGWCNINGEDAWYESDNFTVEDSKGNRFDLVDGLVYNIFPDFSGDVLSGRVLDEEGKPVANAVVQASLSGKVVDSVETGANGIYAFVLSGGTTYKVSCEGHSISVALPSASSAKCMKTSKEEGDIWGNPFQPAFTESGTLGGSSGNDILLSGGAPEPDPEPEPSALGPFNPTAAGKGAYPYCGAVYDEDGNPCGTVTVKFTKPKGGVSKVSASFKMLDGKSYSLASTPVPVSDVESAKFEGKTIKKLGVLDAFEIGKEGFVAEITAASGIKMVAATTDLSKGLSTGVYKFSVSGLPTEINGLPVVAEMLPDGAEVPVNAKGKITLAKAATLKYSKIKGTKPAQYELVYDTSKGKTNLSGLKLTYTAKTSSIKGSFSVYTDDAVKHKIKKTSFTVTGMVIDGKAVGVATCKKPAISCPVSIEPWK